MLSFVLYDVYNIRNYRTCCSILTCALTIEHNVAEHISVNVDGIKYSVNVRKRILIRNHERSNESKEAVLVHLAHTKELDGHIKALCISKILDIDLSDTFCIYILVVYVLTAHKA